MTLFWLLLLACAGNDTGNDTDKETREEYTIHRTISFFAKSDSNVGDSVIKQDLEEYAYWDIREEKHRDNKGSCSLGSGKENLRLFNIDHLGQVTLAVDLPTILPNCEKNFSVTLTIEGKPRLTTHKKTLKMKVLVVVPIKKPIKRQVRYMNAAQPLNVPFGTPIEVQGKATSIQLEEGLGGDFFEVNAERRLVLVKPILYHPDTTELRSFQPVVLTLTLIATFEDNKPPDKNTSNNQVNHKREEITLKIAPVRPVVK